MWSYFVEIGRRIEVEKNANMEVGTIVNIFHGWFLTRVALNTVLPKMFLISYWFVNDDTKLIQNDHLSLGPIWYQLETSAIPYSTNQ